MICSFNFLIFLTVCLNISTVINIKILTNSSQQTQSYEFTSHIADFPSVVLITEMLEICIQTSYDQNVQLILKSYLPVVYGTPLNNLCKFCNYLFLILIIVYIQQLVIDHLHDDPQLAITGEPIIGWPPSKKVWCHYIFIRPQNFYLTESSAIPDSSVYHTLF